MLGLLKYPEYIAWRLPLHINVVHLGWRKVFFRRQKKAQKDMTKNEMRQMDGQERKGEFERDGWLTIRDGWLNKREWWLSLFRTMQKQPGVRFQHLSKKKDNIPVSIGVANKKDKNERGTWCT